MSAGVVSVFLQPLRIALIACFIFLASCASNSSLYTWGKYESSLYKYYKKPAAIDGYMKSLESAIKKGEKRDNVAPGLYAEAGYVYLSRGDSVTATEYFRKEKDRWPQSARFMDSMIESASIGNSGSEQ